MTLRSVYSLIAFATLLSLVPLAPAESKAVSPASSGGPSAIKMPGQGHAPCAKTRRRCRACGQGQRGSSSPAPVADAWLPMFNGQTLAGWSDSEFYHPAGVRVEHGAIVIEMGEPLAGITWQREFPTDEYEIELEAQRLEGGDFFCALTFPVGESFATLVLGGWGGSTVGISSIDNYDASENETTKYLIFENERWYTVRLRVAGRHITAWLDEAEEPLVDIDTTERQLSTRWEVDPSKPLGIAAYQTTAALRNIRYRRLPPETP